MSSFPLSAYPAKRILQQSTSKRPGYGSSYAIAYAPLFKAFRLLRLVAIAFAATALNDALWAITDGQLDPFFYADVGGSGGSEHVSWTALQADRKILFGGTFATVNGQPRSSIARLELDGKLESDGTFKVAISPPPSIRNVAVQRDGKIVVAGSFTTINGAPRHAIARLNPDGSVESSAAFHPILSEGDAVGAVVLQADGKLLLLEFNEAEPASHKLIRVNTDGSADTAFTAVSVRGYLSDVIVQGDGKIVIGGNILSVNGQTRNSIARLHPDGTLESTATFNAGSGADGNVYALAIQGDGKILMGGTFNSVDGHPGHSIARLNPDGSVESTTTFDPRGVDFYIYSIATQADGKCLTAGYRANYSGALARLGRDGSVEGLDKFDAGAGADYNVLTVSLDADGGILLGGEFSYVDRQPRRGAARLRNGPSIQNLAAVGSDTVRWGRGGTAPEVEQVTFEVSEDAGVTWSLLALPARTADGWERSGLSLPPSGLIRARGLTASGGLFARSSGIVEQMAVFPDNSTIPPTLTTPAAGTMTTRPIAISFMLPEPALDGSVTLQFVGDTSHTLVLANDQGTFGRHTVFFDSVNPLKAPEIVSGTPIPDGSYTVTLSYQDTLGHAPASASVSNVAIDTLPPETLITSGPSGAVRSTDATFTFSSNESGASFETSLDFAPFTGTASSVSYRGLIEGTHTFQVRAVDAAGNIDATPETRMWAVELDPVHFAEPAFSPSITGSFVRAIALQPDGKMIIGGLFSSVDGQPRRNLARLNADGTLESTATFNPGVGPDARVNSVVVQSDGKILIGGFFEKVDGWNRKRIARLNADGSVESEAAFDTGLGADENVTSLALQPDGKILVAGLFNHMDGQPRGKIARLNADGSVESTATFNPGSGADGPEVYTVAVQSDGKILLGGSFESIDGQVRHRIARLNPDGTLESDATFSADVADTVFCIAVDPAGKILLGGSFSAVNGETRRGIARLNANGTLESSDTFNPAGSTGRVNSIALQADGKILLGGEFNFFGAQSRAKLARLNPDGTLDTTATFRGGIGEDDVVYAVAADSEGRVLVGGSFTTINLAAHGKITRFANDPATQTLAVPSSTGVRWSRGGSAPELVRVDLELSIDGGASWSALGAASRVPGGWERIGLNLPTGGAIRARGRTSAGYENGSSGLVEQTVSFGTGNPFARWKLATLGDANAPNDGDSDADGLRTIVEYATAGDPLEFTAPAMLRKLGNALALTFSRNAAASDVTLTVQGSDDLLTWIDLARSTGGTAMTALLPGVTVTESGVGTVRAVEVRDLYLMDDASHPTRFLRLYAAP